MMRLFSKPDLKALGSILAFVLLLTTIPLTSGVIIVSGPSHPQFTINVCQPIQAFESVSTILLARPAAAVRGFVLFCLGSVTLKPAARTIECRTAPETPPPKPFA